MRSSETFSVGRPPEVVFNYLTDPSNLADWQTANISVEQLSDGPPGPGSRFRERSKPPGMKAFEQITEFAVYERPMRFHVHVAEGPQPIDGTWILAPSDAGTLVTFTVEGQLRGPIRLLGPLATLLIRRQFASYHRNLIRNLESRRS